MLPAKKLHASLRSQAKLGGGWLINPDGIYPDQTCDTVCVEIVAQMVRFAQIEKERALD